MDPLVEQLKKSSEAEAKRRDTESALRLLNAQIIGAKAPTFWDLVSSRVKAICEELRQEFPNDNRFHLFMAAELRDGFFLNSRKLPRCILSAQLNIAAQRVDLSERIKHDLMDQAMPQYVSPIAIVVGDDNELTFRFQGNSFDTPDELARALVSYVIRFSKVTVTANVLF